MPNERNRRDSWIGHCPSSCEDGCSGNEYESTSYYRGQNIYGCYIDYPHRYLHDGTGPYYDDEGNLWAQRKLGHRELRSRWVWRDATTGKSIDDEIERKRIAEKHGVDPSGDDDGDYEECCCCRRHRKQDKSGHHIVLHLSGNPARRRVEKHSEATKAQNKEPSENGGITTMREFMDCIKEIRSRYKDDGDDLVSCASAKQEDELERILNMEMSNVDMIKEMNEAIKKISNPELIKELGDVVTECKKEYYVNKASELFEERLAARNNKIFGTLAEKDYGKQQQASETTMRYDEKSERDVSKTEGLSDVITNPTESRKVDKKEKAQDTVVDDTQIIVPMIARTKRILDRVTEHRNAYRFNENSNTVSIYISDYYAKYFIEKNINEGYKYFQEALANERDELMYALKELDLTHNYRIYYFTPGKGGYPHKVASELAAAIYDTLEGIRILHEMISNDKENSSISLYRCDTCLLRYRRNIMDTLLEDYRKDNQRTEEYWSDVMSKVLCLAFNDDVLLFFKHAIDSGFHNDGLMKQYTRPKDIPPKGE